MAPRRAVVLILAGACLAAAALLADVLGVGGGPGIGVRQRTAVAVGAVTVFVGWLQTSRGRLWFEAATAGAAGIGLRGGLTLGCWFGLALSVFELCYQAVRKFAFGRLLQQPLAVIWMAPLCYAALFGAIGVLAGVLGRRWPRIVTPHLTVMVMLYVAAWSQLRMFGWLDPTALVVLSAGISWQITRWLMRHRDRFAAVRHRTLPLLAGVFVLAAIAVPASRWLRDSRELVGLPPARAGASNVLFIVLDTVRSDHLSCYGYGRATTPNIDALAERGVLFEQAIAPASWTLPSHASMFTGRFHYQLSADWIVALDDRDATLAEQFASDGYATGGFVGNTVYCRAENGLARGFSHYEDLYVTPVTLALSTSIGRHFSPKRWLQLELGNDAPVVTEAFLSWLPTTEGKPWFAFLNFIDAHAYQVCPEPFATEFGPQPPRLFDWYQSPPQFSEADLQGFRDAYDGCVKYVDHHVGLIIDRLREQGMLENTIVVVTADHGDHFGEHGLVDHGNSLYRALVHVPLIVSWPGRDEQQRVTELVSLRDLGATILDLAGSAAAAFPGNSLSWLWTEGAARPAEPTPILTEVNRGINREEWERIYAGDMKSLFAEGMHYIQNGDGSEELYEYPGDRLEARDLVGTDRGRSAAARMRETVFRLTGHRPGATGER